jgi:hypothetical protein
MSWLHNFSIWLFFLNTIMSSSYVRPFKSAARQADNQHYPWKLGHLFSKCFFLGKKFVLQSSASDSDSVHLALTQRLDKDPVVSEEAENQASNLLEIFEAFDENSNKTVATIAEDKYLTIFASQLHGMERLSIRKVSTFTDKS